MKVSIVTVVYNGERFIENCIDSVRSQSHQDIEYIIIDGNSTDSTLARIRANGTGVTKVVSEPDKGIYDAMNKGIKMATGDIVGILNADDMLADEHVIAKVVELFGQQKLGAVYGDLHYISLDSSNKVIRKWQSETFDRSSFHFGWMPAHPTLYMKRELFDELGYYDLDYGTAADYELMLRFLYKHGIKAAHLDHLMVKMRVGGASNTSIKNRLAASRNDFRAMQKNGIPIASIAILMKPIRKIKQFFL